MGVSSWHDIKQEKLNHMWAAVEKLIVEQIQARSTRNATNRAKLKMLHHTGSKGGKDGNPPDLSTIIFETRKKYNKLVEPEAIEKHVRLAQLEEMVLADPLYLP
ncbi:hypothetical protein KY285_024260 [Solanum tuberosum]|nr:hypothetical protein KY285_024260 [Solanum tuberosum]